MVTINRSVSAAAPTSEPLTLKAAKEHLEIAQDDTTHNDHIYELITAAREVWEYDTQELTSTRTVTEILDNWPDDCWRFYYRPVQSVTTIQYYDTANASQTLATSVYALDAPNRRLHLQVDQDWPDIEDDRYDPITITYVAGRTSTPQIVRHAIKLQLDVMFELRGMTKEKDSVIRAYENLVARYCRGSYP